MLVAQCKICGQKLSKELPHSILEGHSPEEIAFFDLEAERSFFETTAGIAAEVWLQASLGRGSFWDNYNEYLNSDEWRILRRAVLERDGNLCVRCKVRPAEQVHHLTYERVGNELLSDLESVCFPCHKQIHHHP